MTNTMGACSGTGIAYSSETTELKWSYD